jgi:thiosulfate/3-mercaptopyruvate sulfurtransferase
MTIYTTSMHRGTKMTYAHPEQLVSVEQLHDKIDHPNLRLFDTSVFLKPQAQGGYEVTSGFDTYKDSHIKGAGFIDLKNAWAAADSKLNFTLPDVQTLADAIGASGISAEHDVVLYSSGHLMWATRAWWLLHHAGHKNIAILQGNLAAWRAAGLPEENGINAYPAAQFTAEPLHNTFVDTEAVEAGMHGKVCTLNALHQSLYEGTGDFYYQRRGHIPGSKPVFYDTLLDNEHFLPAPALQTALQSSGALDAEQVIAYCGGGIAATVDAFALRLLGHDNVAVYDGSMSAWVTDESRPLTLGVDP